MKANLVLVKSVNWQGLYETKNGTLLDQNKVITDDRINEFKQDGDVVSIDWANQYFMDHFSYFPEHISQVLWSDERF